MTLGSYLKGKRLMLKLTQKALADKMGIAYQRIQEWESNKKTPNSKNLFLLIDILKLDIEIVQEIIKD